MAKRSRGLRSGGGGITTTEHFLCALKQETPSICQKHVSLVGGAICGGLMAKRSGGRRNEALGIFLDPSRQSQLVLLPVSWTSPQKMK